MEEPDRDLLEAAARVRENAYAPYSGYKVGAAVRDENGRVHSGCNAENVSYGATICAERSAVLRMVAEGGTEVRALAVVTEDGGTPCGLCLQVLSELGSSATIWCQAADGSVRTFKLSELLPQGFASAAVARTTEPKEGSTST